MPTVVVAEEISFNRENLLKMMSCEGVDARVFFWPISELGFVGRKAFDIPYFSTKASRYGVNLPSSIWTDH